MSLRLLPLIFYTIFTVQSYGDTNATAEAERTYIDEQHEALSNQVIHWSETIDRKLSSYLTGSEYNITLAKPNPVDDSEELKEEVNSVDAFFQNDKFLEETDDAYVRIRFDANFQSKDDEDFNLKASAQLPLSRSKKEFKFFIDDVSQDNTKDIATDDTEDQKSAPEIGMHYFAPETYGIESKYSVGIRGIYPFVRARYKMVFEAGEWLIEPVQSFKYSVKDDFEEETNVYFDTQLEELSLFRIQLHRKTKSRMDGMDYSLGFSYFWAISQGIGVNLSQTFWGNTEYKYVTDETTDPVTESDPYGGISNYSTALSWRQSVWRKWFFYEVRPGVNFHRQYDYEPNYTIRIYLDFYFGNYLKG